MSEISKLIAEIKSAGILRAGNKLEQLYGLAEQMETDHAALQQKLDALAQLAEERRQFIVNGVDMGYINLPVIDEDKANGIYCRCLLKPKFACDAYLNSVRAEGVLMAHAALIKYAFPTMRAAYTSDAENMVEDLRSGTHDTADKAGAK